jgi:urease accessory protein
MKPQRDTTARLTVLCLSAAAALLLPSPVSAHILASEASGFVSGFKHPISGFDHILAMVSVGLWGAQLGVPALWLLPVTFPIVMACGGFLGLIGVPMPGGEIGIALSALLLGTAVMTQWRPPLLAAAVLVGMFALYHGHAHGAELPVGESALLYSVGFVMATGCLHLIGIGAGILYCWDWGRRALRAAGAGVAMGGVFFLHRSLS